MKHLQFLMAFLLLAFSLKAQGNRDSLPTTDLFLQLFSLDSTLFSAFNNCELEKFKILLDHNLEFYDDREGLNTSWEKEIESFTNRCSQPLFKLRRELVKGSMQVYPLKHYGAVQMGEHLFYESVNGQKEELTGTAKFVHIWQYKAGKWTITRIISYDHKPIKK